MAENLNLYRDREQSFIKHQFLAKYLRVAAYKTLQGHSPNFNFVDAFAGPWRVNDDAKYSDASFDQAINTLEAVRTDLGKKHKGKLNIRFCLCERRSEAVAHLREYAAKQTGVEIRIFEGAFEDNLDAIAANLLDGFTFTFIDPTGWNIRNKEVFRFLRDRRGEFLLNFMSDHINRHAPYSQVAASFGRFLADADWADEYAQLPDALSNERKMLHLLKNAIRNKNVATYVPDFSIMVPKQERVKMRLILGTHSPIGLEVFRDVQEKVERQEMELRHKLREGDSRQPSLFPVAEFVALDQQQKGVGCKANRDHAEKDIVDFLRHKNCALVSTLFNRAMEIVPIRRTQLNNLLIDMRKRGVVRFDLPKRRRVPQPNTRIALPVEVDLIA